MFYVFSCFACYCFAGLAGLWWVASSGSCMVCWGVVLILGHGKSLLLPLCFPLSFLGFGWFLLWEDLILREILFVGGLFFSGERAGNGGTHCRKEREWEYGSSSDGMSLNQRGLGGLPVIGGLFEGGSFVRFPFLPLPLPHPTIPTRSIDSLDFLLPQQHPSQDLHLQPSNNRSTHHACLHDQVLPLSCRRCLCGRWRDPRQRHPLGGLHSRPGRRLCPPLLYVLFPPRLPLPDRLCISEHNKLARSKKKKNITVADPKPKQTPSMSASTATSSAVSPASAATTPPSRTSTLPGST